MNLPLWDPAAGASLNQKKNACSSEKFFCEKKKQSSEA
jgi:hypothetical protein